MAVSLSPAGLARLPNSPKADPLTGVGPLFGMAQCHTFTFYFLRRFAEIRKSNVNLETMPRRKIHLPLTEQGAELGIVCSGDPIFTGDGTIDIDLVCGRCHRTLFLALDRDGVFAEYEKHGIPLTSHGRKLPLVAICDCGAVNRVWPIVID